MSPTNKTEVNGELVDQLCSITDVSKLVATNLLEACNNDLQMAINMHIETNSSTNANEVGMSNEVDGVRAPIPQKQEILIEGPDQLSYSMLGRARATRSVFDKFRDFQVETKRQEEQFMEDSNEASSSTMPRNLNKRKMKTLEDLFRPPLDLMFRGTFQSARDKGIDCKKWLLINIQNSSEFACQVLNRDIWSNSAVKSIVKEHFVFWQIYHDSEEGARYMNFYPVHEWPYIAIVDPRTGECMITWKNLDAQSFCEIITEFITSHSFGEDATSNLPCKKKLRTESNIVEADEASQLEAAIKASLEMNTSAEDSDELETFDPEPEVIPQIDSSEPEAVACQSPPLMPQQEDKDSMWKQYLGKAKDPTSKLLLRLPDGSRDAVDMPCSSTLMALVMYVASKGFSNESYELVTNFPKKNLSYLDFTASLKSVGLFPQETVFVQKR